MTDHQLEDVSAKLADVPIYEDTELIIDFYLEDREGRVDLSNDSVSFAGKNLISGNTVFDVDTTDQDASNGKTRATIDPSDITENGTYIFELRWDKGDTGDITDRIQWKQEVKEVG